MHITCSSERTFDWMDPNLACQIGFNLLSLRFKVTLNSWKCHYFSLLIHKGNHLNSFIQMYGTKILWSWQTYFKQLLITPFWHKMMQDVLYANPLLKQSVYSCMSVSCYSSSPGDWNIKGRVGLEYHVLSQTIVSTCSILDLQGFLISS